MSEQPLRPEDYAKYLPECVDCGACCHNNFADEDTYVDLAQGDAERLKDHKASITPGGSIRTCPGKKGRCACDLLDKRDFKRCTAYKDRPTVCRTFRRGGPECIREYLAFHGKLGRQVNETT